MPTSADCSGTDYVGTCNMTGSHGCTDYYYKPGMDSSALAQSCTGGGGTFMSTPCDPTGAVGACESPLIANTICYYQYSYPPVTQAIAQQVCGTNAKNTFHPLP